MSRIDPVATARLLRSLFGPPIVSRDPNPRCEYALWDCPNCRAGSRGGWRPLRLYRDGRLNCRCCDASPQELLAAGERLLRQEDLEMRLVWALWRAHEAEDEVRTLQRRLQTIEQRQKAAT